MKSHLLAIGMIVIGVMFFGIATAAPLDEALVSVQNEYKRNEQEYQRKQGVLHDLADKIREGLCNAGTKKYCRLKVKVDVTSYNPVVGQTDGSPCIGANSTDICDLYRSGVKPIALSQDLLNKGFHLGDSVKLWHPTCKGANGIFRVEDTMNYRLLSMADIFSPSQEKNVGYCRDAYLLKL